MSRSADAREAVAILRRRSTRVLRGATRLVSTGPPVTGEPRLWFRPDTDRWFVDCGGEWFEPSSSEDLDELLSLLPLDVAVSAHDLPAGAPRGMVRVAGRGSSARLDFLSTHGERLRRITNRMVATPRSATWDFGAHDDGWVETRAGLRLSGVRRAWLHAYLPEVDSAPAKELAVVTTEGTSARVDIHQLVRGDTTRIELYRDRHAARDLVLDLTTSSPEPVEDEERPLGFLAVQLEVLA